MNTTKHFAVAALLVLGAALYPSTSAQAQVDVGTIDLENTGLLPGASGQAALTEVVNVGDYFTTNWQTLDTIHSYVYAGNLTLTCRGLKPGAKYETPLGTFTAPRDGTLSCRGSVYYTHDFVYSCGWWGCGDSGYLGGGLDVYVKNHGNKKRVLSGLFTYPY